MVTEKAKDPREGVLENLVKDITDRIILKASKNIIVPRISTDYVTPSYFIDKIAVLIPTRFRPKIFRRMLGSWAARSVRSDLIVALQKDDPAQPDYRSYIDNCRCKNIFVMEVEDIGLGNKFNAMYKAFPDYDAYALLNDDHVFRTMFWDRKIYEAIDKKEDEEGHRLSIPCWKDGWFNYDLPAGFATKELLHIIKTPVPEGYMSHLYIDNTYAAMSGIGGCRLQLPHIFIEHMHVTKGKAKVDDNYMKHKYSHDHDYNGYVRWLNEKCEAIATEILEIRNNGMEKIIKEKASEVRYGNCNSAADYRPSL